MIDDDSGEHYEFFSENNYPECKYYSVSEFNNVYDKKYLSFMNCNIRSFNKNFDSLSSVFQNESLPSIFCLTETRFSLSTLQNISGYDAFHTTRASNTPSGGISLFIKENLKAKKIESISYSNDTIEICTAEFYFGKQNVMIIGVYRPHSDTIDNFNSAFSDILKNRLLKNRFCILMGDLNICLLKPSRSNQNFSNLLFSNHFIPLITKATRFPQIEGETPSCLDHIWINKFFDLDTGIIDIDISDHLPTFLNLKLDSPNEDEKVKIEFRLINETNKAKFKNLLSNFNWNSIKSQNPNLYADNIIKTLNDLYCSAFPLKVKYVSKRYNHNPWINNSIRKLIRAKSDYFRLYKLSLVTLAENNRFRNKVNSIIRKYKTKFYADMLESSKNDLKRTWATINNILSKNTKIKNINRIICNKVTYTHSADIAKVFNNFFCSIGSEYDSKIPNPDMNPCKFIKVNHSSYFFLEPVSTLEVEYHIKNLKNSKECIDNISVSIFKEFQEFFSHIIADLINTCFETGLFPDSLKKAIVLPLFKKDNPDLMTNYRPISILPKLSKIIEKCLKSRLVHYFTRNNLFNQVQFGFLAEKSTQDAILHLTEKIYRNLHDNLSTLAVYIDFSKCFDTLNRDILIKKLEIYGIRGPPLKLLISYLENRSQAVKVNNTISEFKPINTGVPQGSVLGPLLYLIYVNELPNISDKFSTCLFADDTTLVFESYKKYDLFNKCDFGVNLFFSWCCANRLSINISKTNLMLFSNILSPHDIADVFMNHIKIDYVTSTRFLGIIIDDKLRFNLHINEITKTISKNIGVLYKLSQYVPNSTLLSVYRCIIECYLNYCNLIFGNASATHLLPLVTAQKKAVRIVAKQPPLSHTNPLFSNLKLLKLSDLYIYNLGVYMWKNIRVFEPYFRVNLNNTRSGNYYTSAYHRLTLTQNQSIFYQAPAYWHNIPLSIKYSNSLNNFKKKYKNHLLSSYGVSR